MRRDRASKRATSDFCQLNVSLIIVERVERAEALEKEIFKRSLVIIYKRKIEDSYSVKGEILLRPRKKERGRKE